MSTSTEQESPLLTVLHRFINEAELDLSKGEMIDRVQLMLWRVGVRTQLVKTCGVSLEVAKVISPSLISDNINPTKELEKRLQYLKGYVSAIERMGINTFVNKSISSRIFIGHGQSPMWRELKDFINDRLTLPWDEFNREAVAGITTFDRISDMLDSANFALLIMTSEDQYLDATTHARQNVVHEVGLFQGRLGPKKETILLEQGCEEFSNIVGLSQIRFPNGQISAVFEDIRRVLEREGILKI